jgi:hypothetical protein
MYAHARQPLLAEQPSRHWVRLWLLCLGGLLVVAGAGDNPLPGADSDIRLPARSAPSLNEIEVTIRVRQALVTDPELKGLNLFIRVQAGLATLCGPVPSLDLSRKAERIVRQVRGVYEVVNLLEVVASEEKPFDIPLKSEPPVQSESAMPFVRPNPRVTLAGRTPRDFPDLEGGTEPFPDPKPDKGVALLPPVAQSAPPADPAETVRAWITRVRQEDVRFRPIRVEVRDAQTLWVYDDPYRGDAVAALAARLRRIPGVRTVLIKSASLSR